MPLIEECVAFVSRKLVCATNAFDFLAMAELYSLADLAARCWRIVDINASEVLAGAEFTSIPHKTLCALLERDSLECAELELFKATLRWAEAECVRRGLDDPTSDANKRAVLAEALFLIRFPVMCVVDFTQNLGAVGFSE